MDATKTTISTSDGEHPTTEPDESHEKGQHDGLTAEPPRCNNEDNEDNDGPVEPEYATGLKLFLVMMSICMAALLTALEIGIIATAIPQITDEFHSLGDVGWYGCATFLVVAASSAMWGKLYQYLNVKYVFLASVAVFLVGALPAAAARNSQAVIAGRAVQGWGIGGTMSGSIIVINYVSHPRQHPVLIGVWTAVFMVSTILGPIIGGAFTSGVSWRWCFWINLPLGGPIVLLLLLFVHIPKHIKPTPASWKEIILQLDLPGFGLILASLACFTLALERGGESKAWSNGSVVAALVLWTCLFIAFIVVEWFQSTRAMVPLRLLKPRTTWANAMYNFISNSAFYQVMFYLPIYLQSIHGQSAMTSGVKTLPFLAFFALGAVSSGTIIGKTRHLQPFQLAAAILMTAGMALLYELEVDSPRAWYIGAQVLFGFGVGFGNQVPVTAVQGLSKPEDVPSFTALMFMCQSGSGATFIVVAQSIFANRLLQTLKDVAPSLDASLVLSTGASDVHRIFSGADLENVLTAYMVGIKDVFACALAGSALAAIVALLIPVKKLPDHGEKGEYKAGA